MIIALPVTDDGLIGHSWGKARTVAVVDVDQDGVNDWTTYEVRWDISHDEGTHGAHHARVVAFLREHEVTAVVVDHVGDGMARMLRSMNIQLVMPASGDAGAAALAVVADQGRS